MRAERKNAGTTQPAPSSTSAEKRCPKCGRVVSVYESKLHGWWVFNTHGDGFGPCPGSDQKVPA